MDQEEQEGLIREAFKRAAAAGKNPRLMTTAVLKNRLLDITAGTFSEELYGAQTFSQFLEKFPDLVKIDSSTHPANVEFLEAPFEVSRPDPAQPEDFSPRDLWRAILDYSSGREYVWDSANRQAREASEGDSRPVIPTVAEDELVEWKKEFLGKLAVRDPILLARVETWANHNLTTQVLPRQLRSSWNQELKRRVRQRFEDFASEHRLSPPEPTRGLPEDSQEDRKCYPGNSAVRGIRS